MCNFYKTLTSSVSSSKLFTATIKLHYRLGSIVDCSELTASAAMTHYQLAYGAQVMHNHQPILEGNYLLRQTITTYFTRWCRHEAEVGVPGREPQVGHSHNLQNRTFREDIPPTSRSQQKGCYNIVHNSVVLLFFRRK